MNADVRNDAFQNVINISQGEHAVSSAENVLISTVLGSCVATCLWDEQAAVGGMNHILLPQDLSTTSISQMHGVHAMEVLINAMIKSGAVKSRIRAKLFGGARMVAGLSNIGERNAVFAQEFLRGEGILCEAKNLGAPWHVVFNFGLQAVAFYKKLLERHPLNKLLLPLRRMMWSCFNHLNASSVQRA
ncbi:chemotaxis protein CheD [Falsihalocynthiibacter arcticus]|uniref:chemotaxis protein CheD n=1 Tax=Falsihalocynthiibacter arcticus TaxID=1579316 RepID=UPI001F3D0973|nr:chemotaxis protein CheD [Falsihalocynthiibacter arcticus]